MKPAEELGARTAALETYLARRSAQGFRVETRSDIQAVIVRRHSFHFVLRWFTPGRAQERLVVSVDQDGEVTSSAAEPVRW